MLGPSITLTRKLVDSLSSSQGYFSLFLSNVYYAVRTSLLLLIYIRSKTLASIDEESSKITKPRKHLEEEYLDVEAKVCMVLVFV
jgi:hypothetical protein